MEEKEIKNFLNRNCLQGLNEYVVYHHLLNIQYGYLKDCMDSVRDIKDGLVFDMVDLTVLFTNFDLAQKCVSHFKKKIGLNYEPIDVSEVVNLRGGSIKESEIHGDIDKIVKLAYNWKRNFSNVQHDLFVDQKDFSKDTINHAFYLYELAIYTLLLCDKKMNFQDLRRVVNYYNQEIFRTKEDRRKQEADLS